MPIFEDKEQITPEEMSRQQKVLNEKVARIQWEELSQLFDKPAYESGDFWENEKEE